DLANLVNEAALMAARAGKRVVTMFDFEQAKDKVMMGAERRSMVMTEEEKTMTAYHEGGHAIVNIHMAGNDPLHKVTIIPRGRALGVTWALPEKDRLSITKEFLEAKIAMCFGGRIAEQLIYGENHLNSGASSDIKQATSMARAMVTEYGMSEKLGPLRYVDNQEEVFLGHSVTRSQTISGATAKMIDEEVRRIVEEGETKAREILSAHLEELHVLAKGLLEYETLNADEVKDLLAGKPIRQGGDHSGPHKPRSSIPTTGGTVTRPGASSPSPPAARYLMQQAPPRAGLVPSWLLERSTSADRPEPESHASQAPALPPCSFMCATGRLRGAPQLDAQGSSAVPQEPVQALGSVARRQLRAVSRLFPTAARSPRRRPVNGRRDHRSSVGAHRRRAALATDPTSS
ncbi:MAG: hypothetical protein HC869_07095, partial [Rhodospirillales bacterium]|nr:hypothetical protein [Rhodospirillales bacterium]